jgi:hypothetical protein
MPPFWRCALVALAAGLAILPLPAHEAFVHGGPVSPAGVRATADIPTSQHIRNTGGSDGAGLCVFTSAELSARWQNVPALDGFQQYMRRFPGGGWPEKLDRYIQSYCNSRGVPVPRYVQHTGGDEEFLDLAIRTGRMPFMTYGGKDNFYRGGIYHMVNGAALTETEGAIIDNNRPGVWVWMTRRELLSRWRDMNGGWAGVFLDPPPPVRVNGTAFGQCSGGVCVRPANPPLAYRWGEPERATDGDTIYRLYHGSSQVGAWYGGGYHTLTGPNQYAVATSPCPVAPPVEAPAPTTPVVGDEFPGGVVPEKIHTGRRYFLDGAEVDRETALRVIRETTLRDDSELLHVAAVGSPERIAQMKRAYDSLPAADRDRCHWHGYTPSRWEVAALALPEGLSVRKPTAPGSREGAEVGRLPTDTATDPAQVASLMDGILRPKPPATPTPPTPPKPEPKPDQPTCPCTPQPQWPIWAATALALLFILIPRRS